MTTYLSTYDDDVFISYAHIDNQPFGADQQPWIDLLHEQLAIRLEQRLGSTVSVWRDPRLAGNDVLDTEIFDRIAKCALMISVCSPRYVNSQWCPRELTAFAEKTGFEEGAHSLVFKVLKTPVDNVKLPAPLPISRGYQFYELDVGGKVREFLLEPPDKWWRFYTVVDDLAQDMADTLQSMAQTVDTTQPETPAGETVYLALTSSDVSPIREELRRDLERRGHTVLPRQHLPLTADDAAVQIRDEMAISAASIHILGAHYGAIPEGDGRSYPHLQVDIATELAEQNALHQMVWMAPGTDVLDDSQTELVQQFERGNLSPETEFLVTPLEELKTVANARLTHTTEVGSDQPALAGDTVVYLVFDQADADSAAPIASYLESRGCIVLTPDRTGDESSARIAHQESMVLCEAVLIYQGAAGEQWLTVTLRDLVKARGWGRAGPYAAKALLLGPPASDAKAEYASALVTVIREVDGQLSVLDDFIAQASSERASA